MLFLRGVIAKFLLGLVLNRYYNYIYSIFFEFDSIFDILLGLKVGLYT